MSGMDMLFKSIGINPAELMATAERFQIGIDTFIARADAIARAVEDNSDRLRAIEHSLGVLMARADAKERDPRGLSPVVLEDDELVERFVAISAATQHI